MAEDRPARRRSTGRPTLAVIARSAGVSVATVSKVVNGHRDVAAGTRTLVEDLLRRHDYAAPSARRPSSAPPATDVQFLVDGRYSAFNTPIMEGVIAGAGDIGASVGVGHLRTDRSAAYPPPRTWARNLVSLGRTGLIVVTGELTTEHIDALADVGIPLVVIDPLNLPRRDVVSVGSTNFAGGMTATQHLLDLGHRRIAYVGGPTGSSSNRARTAGYRAALEGCDLEVAPELVVNESFRYDAGRRAAGALLDLPLPPTAVVGGNDRIALGFIEAARARGLRIPDDLSVTGFDDTELASVGAPPLTTVRQPLHEMGRVAFRTVLKLAAGEPLDSHHVELATELVVRGSTAPRR